MRHLETNRIHSAQDVLCRIALELQRCEVMLRGIETAVTPMIPAQRAQSSSLALQDIDLLGQSLADLATCLTGLSMQVGNRAAVDMLDLLSPLRLDDLYLRLGGSKAVELRPDERIALF